METINLEYKDCTISYLKTRLSGHVFTVNLAPNNRQMAEKLGGQALVFDDHQSVEAAIARAKGFVDALA